MHPTSMNVRPRTCRAISSRYRSGTVGRRWRSRRSRVGLVAFIVVSTSLDVAERAELLEALGWNRCRGLRDDWRCRTVGEEVASLHRARWLEARQTQHRRRDVEAADRIRVRARCDAAGRPHDQRHAEVRLVQAEVVEEDAVLAERLAVV